MNNLCRVSKHGEHGPQLAAVHHRGIIHEADYLFAALHVFLGGIERFTRLRRRKHLTDCQALVQLPDAFRLYQRVLDAYRLSLEVKFIEYRIVELFFVHIYLLFQPRLYHAVVFLFKKSGQTVFLNKSIVFQLCTPYSLVNSIIAFMFSALKPAFAIFQDSAKFSYASRYP